MAARTEIVEEVAVILRRGRLCVGLSLRHAVDDDDAVAQMKMIAGNANEPLDQKQVGISRA